LTDQDKNNELNVLSTEDFRVLTQSTRELTKELGLETLLYRILETASQLTKSPDTSIFLHNDRDNSLYIAAATGVESEWVLSNFGKHSEKPIPIDASKAGHVFTTGESLVENRVKDHFSGVDDETNKKTKCLVCSPLKVGDESLGAIQVLNKKSGEYTLRDQVILEYFADQASIAIRNAKLLESLLAHSGLYNSNTTTNALYSRMRELNEDAKTETLSVLFADMRGFTQLCQSLVYPTHVQKKLSEFISILSTTILKEEGIVNKFLGDGVMALFQGEDCSTRAVKCAFAMQEQFSELKKRWNVGSNQQLDFLDLGVGITTDQVILGGIGNAAIRDYTAIGSSVNLAAAFENEARNGRGILCDHLTYTNAKDIVSKMESIEDFVLKKPDQEVGVRYKGYHLKSMLTNTDTNLFISHSSQDKDYVDQLVAQLKEHNINTWYSKDNIPKGSIWTAEIRKAISRSNWLVVIVSENSAASKWCKREVDLAMVSGHLDGKIIPVLLDDTEVKKLNEFLSPIQGIEESTVENVTQSLIDLFFSE